MMVPKPRTKTVLQLVEPPEKSKGDRSSSGHYHPHQHHQQQHHQHQQYEQHSQSPPSYSTDHSHGHGHVEHAPELVQQFEGISLVSSSESSPQPTTHLLQPIEEQTVAEQIRWDLYFHSLFSIDFI